MRRPRRGALGIEASWCAATACALALGLAAGAARAGTGDEILVKQPRAWVAELADEGFLVLPEAEGDGGWVKALVRFEKPRSEVWELISDGVRQKEYRPELDELRTISRDGDVVVDEHRMKVMFVGLTYRVRQVLDPANTSVRWELAPGEKHSLEEVSGYWELHDLDGGGTLGSFGTRVRVASGVPKFIEESMARKSVTKMLERCREWVDSGGTWRP
jgi:hypothetical protein